MPELDLYQLNADLCADRAQHAYHGSTIASWGLLKDFWQSLAESEEVLTARGALISDLPRGGTGVKRPII
jgi:hypothetical protein